MNVQGIGLSLRTLSRVSFSQPAQKLLVIVLGREFWGRRTGCDPRRVGNRFQRSVVKCQESGKLAQRLQPREL